MRVRFNLSYGSKAFVNSLFLTDTGLEIKQTDGSYRSASIIRFCFDGKTIHIDDDGCICVECDELDEEFLKIAKHVPATDKFWSKIFDMVKGRAETRADTVEALRIHAVAVGLKPFWRNMVWLT
jgi:hypothetical protein